MNSTHNQLRRARPIQNRLVMGICHIAFLRVDWGVVFWSSTSHIYIYTAVLYISGLSRCENWKIEFKMQADHCTNTWFDDQSQTFSVCHRLGQHHRMSRYGWDMETWIFTQMSSNLSFAAYLLLSVCWSFACLIFLCLNMFVLWSYLYFCYFVFLFVLCPSVVCVVFLVLFVLWF